MGTTDRLKGQVDDALANSAVGAGQRHVADVAIHRGYQTVQRRLDVWDVKANDRGRGGEVANGTALGALTDRVGVDRHKRVHLRVVKPERVHYTEDLGHGQERAALIDQCLDLGVAVHGQREVL